jgi:hypothetical protein
MPTISRVKFTWRWRSDGGGLKRKDRREEDKKSKTIGNFRCRHYFCVRDYGSRKGNLTMKLLPELTVALLIA